MKLERVEEIFHRVRDLPEAERDAALADLCDGDEDLASMVRDLIGHAVDSGEAPPSIGPVVRRSPPDVMATDFLSPADPRPALSPGVVLTDRFRIEEFIAAGGMGQVYRAHDLELDVPIALKTIRRELAANPHYLRRFKQEVLLARSITHPNVCRIFELGHDEATATSFLTMEFLQGETLASRIQSRGALQPSECRLLIRDMADALDAAHRAGIVHGDFKSPNVMVVETDGEERAVVTDFGLAETIGDIEDDGRHRAAIVGTPAYISPEQVTGDAVGPHSDLYSLGVVLFEMTTGRLPFSGRTPVEMAKAHATLEPPKSELEKLDRNWEQALLRLLAKEPTERYATAHEAVMALEGRSNGAITTSRSLPAERDAFVGRDEELAKIESLFAMEEAPANAHTTRLLTLRGPGGTGKTRLAQRYGWNSLPQWPGGVWFCDLSEARNLADVVSSVAAALDVSLTRHDPIALLGHVLEARGKAVFVFDNFEQVVIHAEETIGRWIRMAPEARFLVTSREPLRLPQENVFELEPLDPLTRGVELFESRAWGHRPGFSVDADNRKRVEEIVLALDGLPLAIELAASRLRQLNTEELQEGLQDRFRVLAGDRQGRHGTMEATLDWSWDLLLPWEREVVAQVSAFEGGFTLESAEAVLDVSRFENAPGVVDILQSLVDKSWLRAKVSFRAPRFEMYVTVQDYAATKLEEAAEGSVRIRHGVHFSRMGSREQIAALDRSGGVERREQLRVEMANLLSACRHAIKRDDPESASGCFCAAAQIYLLRGPFAAGRELGAEVLETSLTPTSRVAVLHDLGQLDNASGHVAESGTRYEEALGIHRELEDRAGEAKVLGKLGVFHRSQGRAEEARPFLEQSLAIAREIGQRVTEAVALSNLGVVHGFTGNNSAALECYEAALAIQRDVGNRRQEGLLLGNLAILHREQGRFAEARQFYEEALFIHREVGARSSEAIALGNLANLHRNEKRRDEARQCYEASLSILREIGNRHVYGVAIGNLGDLLKEEGKPEDAQAAYEESLQLLHEVGDRRFAAVKTSSLGELHRSEGRFLQARELFAEAETLLRELGDLMYLGQLLGSRAHLELDTRQTENARATLAEIEALVDQLEVSKESELGQKVVEIRRRLGDGE